MIFFEQGTALIASQCGRDWHASQLVLMWHAHLHVTCQIMSVIRCHHMGLIHDLTHSMTRILANLQLSGPFNFCPGNKQKQGQTIANEKWEIVTKNAGFSGVNTSELGKLHC